MNIVDDHQIVTISYELRDSDNGGELLERMDANYPFKFLFGSGKLLPAFEENLRGLKESDTFEFVIAQKEAYGPVHPGNIIDVPMRSFKVNGSVPDNLVVKGNFVALTDDEGETHHGKIIDFSDEKVKVDFNHAMAGRNLHFKGVILNIRKATVDELVRKHYIEEDGIRGPEADELW